MSDLSYDSFLGKTVTVIIERPIGSSHPQHGFIYPVNYGHVTGTVAEVGELVDVYILGTNRPRERVSAVVIGIAWRQDDLENKLIVTLDGSVPSLNEVESAVHFQEQFIETRYTLLH